MAQHEWKQGIEPWPSRRPLWTLAGVVFTMVAIAEFGAWESNHGWSLFSHWTELQRIYFSGYVRTLVQPGTIDFRFVEVETPKGRLPALNEDIQSGAPISWGAVQPYDTKKLYPYLKETFYGSRTPWEMLGIFGWLGVGMVGLAVGGAVRQDVKGWAIRRNGRQLRGPLLVSVDAFNEVSRPEGIALRVRGKGFRRRSPATLRIPRAVESMHALLMGDSGTGKTALIKQMLMQIESLGEHAIVYDPALEFASRFYRPERGDTILNPLDGRSPYWNPSDEVKNAAEAATIAESLFPDTHRDNPFFVEGPRKLFAHLLTLQPSPQDLVQWLSDEHEIDERVKGTPLASMVYAGAQQQRGGMLASLSMIADSLKLLPRREDTKTAWSAAAWAKKPKGWIFLTSTPAYRKPLRPLISLWLDLLVLRLMNQGIVEAVGGRVWFVLDELASLQRLPQLHTAITENRKSGNPVVLGFQGRSQLETRYGHDAEAMLSQPAVKVFLRTSEPHSAEWISKTIGDVEVERLRASESNDQFPHHRASQGFQTERTREPLVMASQIQGLPPLQGYLKCGNHVVKLDIEYVDVPKVAAGFVPRENAILAAPPAAAPITAAEKPTAPPAKESDYFE
jgi:hypothetical protein